MSSAAIEPAEAKPLYAAGGNGSEPINTKKKIGRSNSSLSDSFKMHKKEELGGKEVWNQWWKGLDGDVRHKLQEMAFYVAIAECGDVNLTGDEIKALKKAKAKMESANKEALNKSPAPESGGQNQPEDDVFSLKGLPGNYPEYCLYSAKSFNRLKKLFHGVEHGIVNEELGKLGMSLHNRMVVLKHLSGVKTPIQMEDNNLTTLEAWVSALPVINILYDFLLDETPSFSQVVDTVNGLVLVAALMAAVVVTIPTSFQQSEFDEFLEQFDEGGVYNCVGREFGEVFIKELIMNSGTAISYSSSAVCVFVMFLVCGSCANFDPYIFEEGAPEDPYNPFESKPSLYARTHEPGILESSLELRTNYRFAAC
jgi:hypothetical protein